MEPVQHFGTQVLTTKGADGADIEQWRLLANKCPMNDIFFTPEYALLFEATKGEAKRGFGGEARLYFCGDERNYIIYPFFLRRISDLPFAKFLPTESRDWWDITSPYGYSGPLACISEPKNEVRLWKAFLAEFHSYCTLNNIVDEFARLNPFVQNHLPLHKLNHVHLVNTGQIVYIDLQQNETQLMKAISRGNKSAISKARNKKVEIHSSKTKDDINTFYQLYTHNMERNKAKKSYFFSNSFFHQLFVLLSDGAILLNARYQNRTIATAIFLCHNNLIHYYLGASDPNFLHLRPNNLLLFQAILWAQQQGYKTYNLGGGRGSDDSLFRFKMSFSKTTTDFYTYKKVHATEKYRLICQAREDYDKMHGKKMPMTDYFPQYRR